MHTKHLAILFSTLAITVGCTQIKNPDGSVTTIMGETASDTLADEASEQSEKTTEIIDNRELHINSHNMSTSPEPIVVPETRAVVNPPNRFASYMGANGLDSTVYIPSRYLQETPESKSVKTGAAQFAMAEGCMFLQRYRIAINADFTGTMNLMKYRAAGMGAERLNIQFHAESTPFERIFDYGASMFLVDGTQTLENQVFTVMEADLFDCG